MFQPFFLYFCDGYKIGHKKMLAKGTTRLYGTWIPRSLKYAPKGVKKIVSFGQQIVVRFLKEGFDNCFFNQPIEKAEQFGRDMNKYLGMDYDASHFIELHKLGYLPIRIKALPEGIETNPNIPHMTFVNTVDGYAWLTLFLETVLSALAWKSSTSATISKTFRRNLTEWVAKTDEKSTWFIDYGDHDFSARGMDVFSMITSGLGHATSSRGSDTLVVIPAARHYYDEPEDEVCINSVNASEHSVSTTKIFTVGEQQMIADWLQEFPKGILSIVSDTFDLWKLITEYLPANKEAIMRRGEYIVKVGTGNFEIGDEIIPAINDKGKSFYYSVIDEDYYEYSTSEIDELVETGFITYTPGKLVIRPDSGNPVDIICGTGSKPEHKKFKYSSNTTNLPEWKGVVELLWNIFGGTVNEQGYKVLDSHIGAIYGDSITVDRQVEIYERLAAKGFATTNIVLGIGSYTYQMNSRDTLGFAAKGSWFEVKECGEGLQCVCSNEFPEGCEHPNKKEYAIYKDPITDDGTKKSLKGLLRVDYDENGEIVCYTEQTWEQENSGLMQTILEDSKLYNSTTLTEVRNRLNKL